MVSRPSPAPGEPHLPPQGAVAELELVRRVVARDAAAVDALATYLAKVPRIVQVQRVRNGLFIAEQDLADVVQDCLAMVWRKLPEFEGRAALATWVFRIVSLELRNAVRRVEKRRRSGPPADAIQPEVTAPEGDDPSRRWSPLEIEELLARLEPTPTQIIRMRHFEERSFDEIAVALAMKTSKVKTIYYRTLTRMHDFLSARGMGSEER